MNKKNLKLKHQGGFTLVEILIVITLMGFLLTFGVINIMGRFQEGKQRGTKIIMKQMQAAMDDYYRSCSTYPTNAQGGLDALTHKPTVPPDCKNYDPNGYLKDGKIPKDGWDNDFLYNNEDGSNKYTLKSLGADRKEGGEGYDKDLEVHDPDF